ncbi:dimerization and cyclophilin-binding domain of mon2 domain-containing protein [Ditylenchus destructor]|nr:dimerization and cyclophilin-binding domain of mon2 domain-containing protein [Ditylenchus destructor]
MATNSIVTASMASLGLAAAQNDPKKLVEYLLSDLRNLSTEAKKKHNHVKEAAESGIVKVRNINSNSASENLLQNIRGACAEVLHPLILGCSSKNPRLVQISLQAIQRMLQYRVVDPNSAPVIVNELWHLTEAECEELRVLQTITPFVSTELLVTDWALAKCIVIAIKLNFSKDPSVINAASAAVRQSCSCVFERVVQEDGVKSGELHVLPANPAQIQQHQAPQAPPTLRPAAADGYLLLRDLTLLIRKENPTWLVGCKRITLTLALELLESVLKNYPSIFFKHSEYAELLKTQICPQLVRMFVGDKEIRPPLLSNQSKTGSEDSAFRLSVTDAIYNFQQQNVSTGTARPTFPIMMRSLRIALVLVTHYHAILGPQNEVLITFLLELIPFTPAVIDSSGTPLGQQPAVWQAAMALEVLHKMVAQPQLL